MPRSPPARPPASTPRAAPRRRPDQRLISPAPLRVPLTFLPDEGESEPVPASGTTPYDTLGSSPPVARSFSPARLNAVGAGPAASGGPRAEPACTTWSEKTRVTGTRNRTREDRPSRRGTSACPQLG